MSHQLKLDLPQAYECDEANGDCENKTIKLCLALKDGSALSQLTTWGS